jgi:Cu-Zn family superoxide dismutase
MKSPILISLSLSALLVAGCVPSVSGGTKAAAVADLVDATGKPAGTATVTASTDGLWLDVSVKGVTAGPHGLHVHTVGKCEAPDFATAGGHWNPTAHQHGHKNPQGPHAGDAPNLIANARGAGRLKTWLGAGLIASGDTPLLDTDGAAVVLHADADDEMTDPSGKSGKRILCGVLRPR